MDSTASKPRILVLDIETKPTKAYVWQAFKATIGVNQIIEPGNIICFGAQWLGNRDVEFYSDWADGHRGMIEQAFRLISEADAVITYNGDKFDIPILNGEFLRELGSLPPTITSIDILKTIKYKLRLFRNNLAFVGPYMDVGLKMKHEGFELWIKVMEGNVPAQKRMERYCKQDVRLTGRLYMKIRPIITNHPHMGTVKSTACGACGSTRVQSRGWRRTRAFRIQRMHCQNCASWFDGRKERMS